jgi:hypothetical protein
MMGVTTIAVMMAHKAAAEDFLAEKLNGGISYSDERSQV